MKQQQQPMVERLLTGFVGRFHSIRRRITRRPRRPWRERQQEQQQQQPSETTQDDKLVLLQPFVTTTNPAAPDPSRFWSPSLASTPLPTNAAWLNFVLNEGTAPEYLHPYLIQISGPVLSICYPARIVEKRYIIQSFVPDITVGCSVSSSQKHSIVSYDDLSVTLELGAQVTIPLVRGCPYITFIYNSFVIPHFSTINAVLGVTSNDDSTKHKVVMNNGQVWLLYSSEPLHLSSGLNVTRQYKGVIRVAMLSGNEAAEALLDKFSAAYPLDGRADLSIPFQVKYDWRKCGYGDLLMLSLPIHREMMSFPSNESIYPCLSYNSIDGKMHAVVSDSWVLTETPISVGWYSTKSIVDQQMQREIADVLRRDVAALVPITHDSTYYHGKALARAARLAIIAEEVGCLDVLMTVRNFLRRHLTPWMEGEFSGNAFLYDSKWGGVVSRNGSQNAGADFGLGVYNDHHYHLGYFCYVGAVLANLDPIWGRKYRSHLYTIVEDFMTFHHPHLHHHQQPRPTVARSRPLFPRLRNFDLWVMHSWAGGLTEFADGRNQESVSESIAAYYSASLLGRAFKDDNLVRAGLTLAAFEIRAARALWHVPSDSTLYEPVFVSTNRVVGVLWSNKRDSGLWFAPPEWHECRLGIQMLPVLPVTELLFEDVRFVQELVEWAWPSLSRPDAKDGWKGFVYMLQALYAPRVAYKNIIALSEHDDGNSLSNSLWWVFSRQ